MAKKQEKVRTQKDFDAQLSAEFKAFQKRVEREEVELRADEAQELIVKAAEMLGVGVAAFSATSDKSGRELKVIMIGPQRDIRFFSKALGATLT